MNLKGYLEELCRAFGVRAIAEEMSEEALSYSGASSSVPQRAASAMRVSHRYCDPSRAERARLDIPQENEIRKQAFFSDEDPSEQRIEALIANANAKRELCWMKELVSLNKWPVLFVCGAEHVSSFSNLLAQQDISVHVASADWPDS